MSEDPIEKYCCGIAGFVGLIGAIGGVLTGKTGGEVGYFLGGLFVMTWIVILFLQGIRWIYRKITKNG